MKEHVTENAVVKARITDGSVMKARVTKGALRVLVYTGDLCRAHDNEGVVVSTPGCEGAQAEICGLKGSTKLLRATQGAVGGTLGKHEAVRWTRNA